MQNVIKILNDALLETFLIFVGAGSVLTLIIGFWMFFKPQDVLRLNDYFGQWFATSKLTAPLDRQRSVDRLLYRYHRAVGALLLGASAYLLYVLFFQFNPDRLVLLLRRGMNPHLAAWLIDLLEILLIGSSLVGLVIGAIMLVRPSLLKGVEAALNKWVVTEHHVQALDAMRHQPDQLVAQHIRIVSVLVILGSAYAVGGFAMMLLGWR